MRKTVQSTEYVAELGKKVSQLRSGGDRFADVDLRVGSEIFHCHRLVLLLSSEKYFDNFLQSLSRPNEPVDLPEFDDPLIFNNILNYLYRGEVELSDENVERMLAAANILDLDSLKKLCSDFMIDEMNVKNCLRYWKTAVDNGVDDLALLGSKLFLAVLGNNFSAISLSTDLRYVDEDMMRIVLEDEKIITEDEVNLIEMMLRWMHVQKEERREFHTEQLLPCIRWSGVRVEYIRSSLLTNSTLTSSPGCLAFLTQVVSYLTSGIPFEGLQTFYRPATGIERSVVIVGVNDGKTMTSSMQRVSLQRRGVVDAMPPVPTAKMPTEISACQCNGMLYLTGAGARNDEVWRYELVSGWSRCADLVVGRRRHCLAAVGANLFLLGGYSDAAKSILDGVERLNTLTNKSKAAGSLAKAVHTAACVVYNSCVYIFGGNDPSKPVNHVQMYDTAMQGCTLLKRPMPRPMSVLRAALFQSSVIILMRGSCFVFDLETLHWSERQQFKTDVLHFGAVLENQTIYIVGGGNCKDKVWITTDEVKSTSVLSILRDEPPVWNQHARLTKPCMVQAFSTLTLPI